MPWRDRYAEARERIDAGLPYDEEAERGALGALLLAPREHAVRLARRAYKDHFYDRSRGWLWERLSFAVRQGGADFGSSGMVLWWLIDGRICERYRDYFQGSAACELGQCLRVGFWWHGHYYVDRLIAAARIRARIERATEELSEALDAADEGRNRTSKWL